jgi:16S rRNA (guanine(966)-N(2))-methyltransferase RsmD
MILLPARDRYTRDMRVIAGEFRGRMLAAPPGRGTRPILDRVKVALFDWLGSRLAQPGHLPPLAVLDIFSGGGSLGIEALSRGVATCVFVESDKSALQCLRSNLETLGLGARTRVLPVAAELANPVPVAADAFSLIFLDPPYRLSEDVSPKSVMGCVFKKLGDAIPLTPDATVVWRYDAAHFPTPPEGWVSIERRVWGTMGITILSRSSQEKS